MTDFYFNDAYDMSLDGSDIAFTDDDNKVVQRLATRLQFITGEWFLDITAGLPYPEIIFEAGTSIDEVYNLLRDKIKNTDGVEKINSLTLTPDTEARSLAVSFSVNNDIEPTEITLP